jgi:anti-sigma factor RsiW
MNAGQVWSALGPCEEHAFELAEYVDDALAPEQRAAIERHLEECGRCRAFVQEFAAVTGALAKALPRVELSPDFDARLQARIDGLTRADKEAARALAEQEYHGAMQALRRGLTWSTALNALATASVGGGVVTVVASTAPHVLMALGVAQPTLISTSLGIGLVALIGGVLTARALARPRALSSLLAG